jgi:hypothetical protein
LVIESIGRLFFDAAWRIDSGPGPVVDAEGLGLVLAHVAVDPGDADFGVVVDDAEANLGPLAVHRDA